MGFLSEIFTKLTAIDGVSAPLKNIESSFSNFQDKVEAGGKKLQAGLDMGAKLSLISDAADKMKGLGEAAFEQVKGIADVSGDLNDLSGALGMSTKALQEYQYMGKMVGVDTESMNGALTKLTTQLGKGDNKEFEETLEGIGLSAKKLKEVAPDHALDLISDALKNAKDPATAAAVATQLFGKSNAKMVNVLMGGSQQIDAMRKEANDLGAVLSGDLVNSGDAFGDSLDKMTLATRGLSGAFSTALLPVFQPMIDNGIKLISTFTKWTQQHPKIAAGLGIVASVLGGLAVVAGTVVSVLGVIGAVAGVVSAGAAIMAGAFGVVGAAIGGVGAALAAAGAAALVNPITWIVLGIALAAVLLIKFWKPISGFFINLWGGVTKVFTGAWNAIVGAFGRAKTWLAGFWAKWGQWISIGAALFMPIIGLPLLIIQNWTKITDFFKTLWSNISNIFSSAVSSILGFIPDWVKDIFTGGSHVSVNATSMAATGPAATGAAWQTGIRSSATSSTTTNKQEVTVNFANMPKGTRVDTKKASGLNYKMGYNNVGY